MNDTEQQAQDKLDQFHAETAKLTKRREATQAKLAESQAKMPIIKRDHKSFIGLTKIGTRMWNAEVGKQNRYRAEIEILNDQIAVLKRKIDIFTEMLEEYRETMAS